MSGVINLKQQKNKGKVLLTSLAAAAVLIAWLLRAKQAETEWLYTSQDYHDLPVDSLDVLAIGSQRMQTMFNPASYYTASGYYSYVLHADCETMAETYLVLEEALRTQHPSVVLIDVTPMLRQTSACIVGDHAVTYQDYSDDMGYIFRQPDSFQPQAIETYSLDTMPTLSSQDTGFVLEIQGLCQQYQITPVFVNPPFDQTQSDADRLMAISDYILRKHLTLIDCNALASSAGYQINLDGSRYVSNTWGAELMTNAIVDQTVDFVQNHSANALLEERLNRQVAKTEQFLFSDQNADVDRMLEFAERYPVITLVRYNASSLSSITEDEEGLFSKLGLSFSRTRSLYAIVDHGNVIQSSNQPFSMNYRGWGISFSSLQTMLNEEALADPQTGLQLVFLDRDALSSDPLIRSVQVHSTNDGLWQRGCDGYSCDAAANE